MPYERWLHITDPTGPHPYMVNLRAELELTLQDPDLITRSNKDPERVRIYQKWIRNTAVGDKWVRVIVQFFDNGDAFVLTAFASRARYSGERLWSKE